MKETEVIKLYETGSSTYQIAEHFQTYPNKIRRILTKHGVLLKSRSQAQKNALHNGRAKHPTVGTKRTKEERLKISSSVHEYWSSMSEDEHQHRCDEAKRRWHSMPADERDRICSMAIKAIQKAGKEGSKMEKFLSEALNERGYSVEFHKKDLIPTQNLEIDLYIPSLTTIIEIDGPSHFFPIWGEEKLQKQIIADNQKSGIILSKGYIIIRVKNLLDFVSLCKKEELINNVVAQLQSIERKFPPKSKRFIEIEL
jgi:very-short-patch-repair endonuclease|tara:strand:+ start:1035 stop:1799 length:765 start_codon:yes stop_codon:yes gene_type:complete